MRVVMITESFYLCFSHMVRYFDICMLSFYRNVGIYVFGWYECLDVIHFCCKATFVSFTILLFFHFLVIQKHIVVHSKLINPEQLKKKLQVQSALIWHTFLSNPKNIDHEPLINIIKYMLTYLIWQFITTARW